MSWAYGLGFRVRSLSNAYFGLLASLECLGDFFRSLGLYTLGDLVVFQLKVTKYRPQNTIILNMGTPKKVSLILGDPKLQTLSPKP